MLGLRAILFPLIGGALIGLAASLLLVLNGRVAGISGILGNALRSARELWRWMFLGGLLAGGLLMITIGRFRHVDFFGDGTEIDLPMTLVAGVLVGFGTRLGSGCTSGHGVCGISRLSLRSIAATCTFILAGVVTVAFITRVLGWVMR